MMNLNKTSEQNISNKHDTIGYQPDTASTQQNYHTKSSAVTDFYEGKSVFITGGTGFLGMVFIEKILHCFGIDTIYVLIREKKCQTIDERIKEITDNELFSKLRETKGKNLKKIVPIAGDITLPNLGIKPEDDKILREKVSIVFHSAASVRFIEPLTTAVNINIEGTRRVLSLCKRMKNIQAFVHVSTAYANCNRPFADEIIYPPPRKLEEVHQFATQQYDEVDLKKFMNGFPNTYTFTKAIAEHYVKIDQGGVPSAIVRPSIVTPTLQQPLAGWLQNWQGATRAIYDVASGVNHVQLGHADHIIDLIPVDLVANLAVTAATQCQANGPVKVYHSCSSSINPVSIGYLNNTLIDDFLTNGYNTRSFPKLIFAQTKPMVVFLTFVLMKIPSYIADFWLLITGRKPSYVKTLSRAVRTRDTLEFFLKGSWVFHSRNVSDLYNSLSATDRALYPSSPADINWKSYIMEYGRGIMTYLKPFDKKK